MMDPTRTLEFIRANIRPMTDIGLYEDDVVAIASAVVALDDWITKGGFLPEQWNVPRPVGRPRHTSGAKMAGVPHGNRGSYNKGCHCLPCTAANRIGRNLTPTEIKEYS